MNSENQQKVEMEAKGINTANNVINGIYRTTHYRSYHAYHKALRFSTKILWLAFFLEIISFLPWVINGTLISSLGLLLLVIYLLYYYWVISKARGLKADSKKVMELIAVNGYVCKSWNIYDGILATGTHESLEIAFTQEHSYLYNLWTIFSHKESILPPSRQDIDGLKNYLYRLSKIDNKGIHYIAYATLTDDEASLLSSCGIMLNAISDKFITKPNRTDYAAGLGNFKYAFFKYPNHFKAYILTVNEKEYLSEQKEKSLNEQHEKKLNKKMIKLH